MNDSNARHEKSLPVLIIHSVSVACVNRSTYHHCLCSSNVNPPHLSVAHLSYSAPPPPHTLTAKNVRSTQSRPPSSTRTHNRNHTRERERASHGGCSNKCLSAKTLAHKFSLLAVCPAGPGNISNGLLRLRRLPPCVRASMQVQVYSVKECWPSFMT